MYAWTCSCGDGAASVTTSWEEACKEGELHVCRAGRLRAAHMVHVRPTDALGAA